MTPSHTDDFFRHVLLGHVWKHRPPENKHVQSEISDTLRRARLFQGLLTTGAFLAAVCTAAQTRTRAAFRPTLAAAQHLTWPAGGYAGRRKHYCNTAIKHFISSGYHQQVNFETSHYNQSV